MQARALEEVEVVPGRCDRLTDHEHAVVGEQHHPDAVAHRLGQPVALALVDDAAAVLLVEGQPAVVADGVLAEPGVEAVGRQRQCGGVGHVRVDHAGRVGPGVVQPGVEPEGSQLGLARPLDPAGAVDDQQVGRPQLRPVGAVRVQQEPVGLARHREADVVVDPLVEAVQHGGAQDRDEVEPGGALRDIHGGSVPTGQRVRLASTCWGSKYSVHPTMRPSRSRKIQQ